ncbi:MAG TPA: hypothetical protein VNA19_15500 [Pyrinomonadaceae bacterium]|jgi:hypothetical protein|nr:hypothetical protein [Pyrinomonadaceae bacterium]
MMNRKSLSLIFALAMMLASVSVQAYAQDRTTTTPAAVKVRTPVRSKRAQAQRRATRKKAAPVAPNIKEAQTPQLSAEASKLVEGSKQAILATGISEPYFRQHFRPVRVVDQPGNRFVEWRYSVNEYETLLTDSVGYTTIEGKRVNIHSIGTSLRSTSDINKTIPKRQARRIIKDCIGQYSDDTIIFQPLRTSQKAALYLTATSATATAAPAPPVKKESAASSTPAAPPPATKTPAQSSEDMPLSKGRDVSPLPPFWIGYVNLETGECIKGRGVLPSKQSP